jgi:hypothetical protein
MPEAFFKLLVGANKSFSVMPGQKARSAVFAPDVPGIHVLSLGSKKGVDGRA